MYAHRFFKHTLSWADTELCFKTITNNLTVQHYRWCKEMSNFHVDSTDDLFELTNVYQQVFGKEPYGHASLLYFPC